MREVMKMPNEPDYKTAYETMSQAISEVAQILAAARIRTLTSLSISGRKELEEAVLELPDPVEALSREE